MTTERKHLLTEHRDFDAILRSLRYFGVIRLGCRETSNASSMLTVHALQTFMSTS